MAARRGLLHPYLVISAALLLLRAVSGSSNPLSFAHSIQDQRLSNDPHLNIDSCDNPNIQPAVAGSTAYLCTQPYGDRIIFLRAFFVGENELAYSPGAFKIEDFFTSVQQGIDFASAAGDAIIQGNEWSPYSTYPWPANNWTHGESAIYLESPPCNGTLPFFGGAPLHLMQQARYSDIAASLTATKAVFKNSGRTDTTGNALVIFQMFGKDEPPRQRSMDAGAVFGWITLQNTRGEYRRYSYQGPASQKCEGEVSKQQPPEGVTAN